MKAMSPRLEMNTIYEHNFGQHSFSGPLQLDMNAGHHPHHTLGSPHNATLRKKKRAHHVRQNATATTNSSSSSQRHVHFKDETVILNPEPEYYTEEDIETKWWNGDELSEIKSAAKNQSLSIRKTNKASECSLTMAHHKIASMTAGDFRLLVKLTETTPDQDLLCWCSFADGRRGLERFASKDYSGVRRRDVQNVRLSVLEEQYNQQRKQRRETPDEEAIARVSLEGSRRARTFAHFIAEADAKQAQLLYPFSSYPVSPAKPEKHDKLYVAESAIVNPAMAA